ncbi:hypothetical protein PAXRUDRAFT_25655 [Paxillus rubicundulus Ve08.2h10]|uniref:Uncharacterized protein n=1 Tax=Paxillus rubicundulus Ve08.2h10 TaxID=930991 RepID=A0A0D0DQW3_9AGAM|nr:hypothetical protein PAXRUDRAFT_25655 [Paxillus rubicundulus Ve08.2h10]
MDKYSFPPYNQRSGQTSSSKQTDHDAKPVTFQFKLGTHQQPTKPASQGVSNFFLGLQTQPLGLTQSSNLSENTPQRGFDTSLQQSPFKLSSRYVEPHAHGTSAYVHHTPENADRKPRITGAGTLYRHVKDEPAEIEPNARSYPSSRASTRDFPQTVVKVKTEEPDAVDIFNALGGPESDDLFGPVSAKFRQLQKETTQQREYIANLESQLAAKNEEHTRLSRMLIQTESAHKQVTDRHAEALDRAMKNYSALKSEFDEFKLRSQSSSFIISEAKATMESLVALRDSTQLGLRDLESMFDDNGRLILSSETREVVHELRSELLKTQQVADLLRDKLHVMGTDLAEARARISELEGLTVGDRNSVESATLKLRQSVTRYLQEQKHESVQAVTNVYEMEQQLAHTQAGITSLQEVREENNTKLRALRHTIEFQEEHMKGLEARSQKADEELIRALNRGHELQGRLDSTKELEQNLMQQASRLLSERDETKEKLESTERQLIEVQNHEKSLSTEIAKALIERNVLADKLKVLNDMKRDIDLYREKYGESRISLKVLQERFDDQCVTLAATKESVGDLQEVLVESKRDICHLEEQKGILQAKLDQTDRGIEAKAESLMALQMELSRREGASQTLLGAERQRTNEALAQILEMKTRMESLLTEITQKDHRIQEMDKCLAAAEAPSTEREREVKALKGRISELEETEKRLLRRAVTITNRYEGNDLNDDEKELVALLMQKARAIHDREMVEKTNDIKRRDNIIKQHEARITQLEDGLARRIYDEPQSVSVEDGDEQGNSMTVGATKSLPDHQPETQGTGPSGASACANRGAADAIVNQLTSGPSSRSTGHTTFSKLCREDTDDIADFEEAKPQIRLANKRVMFADDVEEESSRPARRVKHSKGPEVERMVDKASVPALAPGTTKKRPGVTKRR